MTSEGRRPRLDRNSTTATTEHNSQRRNSSSEASTLVQSYYGSREPKQSTAETDRVILEMMDNIQKSTTIISKDNDSQWELKLTNGTTAAATVVPSKQRSLFWRFRLAFCSVVILLFVIGMFSFS